MPTSPPNDSPDTPSSPYSPAKPDADASASLTPTTVPPVVPPTAAVPPVPPPPATGNSIPAPYSAVPPAPYLAGPQKPPTTLSLLAMIFGIVGIVLSCCYGAGFLFGVAGIVLGHLGRKRESAQGMALAGLITGYTGVGVSLVMWLVLFGLAFVPLLMLPFLSYS